MYVRKNVFHKRMDQPLSGVFRIGGDAGDAAHVHNFIMDVDFHGVDHDHGCQLFMVKPSQHIGFL